MGLVDYPDSPSSSEDDEINKPGSPTRGTSNTLKRKLRPDHDEDLRGNAALASPGTPASAEATRLSPSRPTSLNNALPPLPAAFHDLYATNVRVSTRDDPSLHGGRKRAQPHVEGNWPSHVYLECEIS
jgi:hypothetical protein